MGIGASIFLIAIGLILAFAVEFEVAGIDIQVIGLILAAAGVVGIILTLAVFAPRRRAATRETVVERPAAERVVEERRYDDGRPPA